MSALGEEDVLAVQSVVRERVLRLFGRRALLCSEAVADMRAWHHGGFSVDASVTVSARDRAGLERLLRYCARPAFASQRLAWETEGERLLYRLPKPRPDGQAVLCLTPLELIERLAALIPAPRRHRHRYHGVLAPNSPLRAAITARAGQPISAPNESADTRSSPPGRSAGETTRRCPSAYLWAVLLARIYECFPLTCRRCGAPMELIAFSTAPASVKPILAHLGLPTEPPTVAPARGPPHDDCDSDQTPLFDTTTPDPEPQFQFDQSVTW